MRGLLEHGILGCIKHFPGHGDTAVDSHFSLPVIEKNLESIRQNELKPFAALINQGAPMVMTSHILFPGIDQKPATLSTFWLQEILRGELGFNGVIVTDDLDMKAVSERSDGGAALGAEALQAGCELFIVARHPDGSSDKPLTMAKGLQAAIINDKSLHTASENAKEKIEYLLKTAVGTYQPKELEPAIFAKHQALSVSITE